MKFAGIGIQLALTIVAFVFLGIWLDKRLNTSFPYFTVFFALFSVVAAMVYLIYKTKPNK